MEIIAVCSQIHTKHINTLFGQNVELLNVKNGDSNSNHWILKGPRKWSWPVLVQCCLILLEIATGENERRFGPEIRTGHLHNWDQIYAHSKLIGCSGKGTRVTIWFMDIAGWCREQIAVLIGRILLWLLTINFLYIYELLSIHQRPMKDQVQYGLSCAAIDVLDEWETQS
jgi:hypothetical protein